MSQVHFLIRNMHVCMCVCVHMYVCVRDTLPCPKYAFLIETGHLPIQVTYTVTLKHANTLLL